MAESLAHTGGAMNPFTAWILLKGLETMDLRVRAQQKNALIVANGLQDHPKLSKVIYPGLPSHPQHGMKDAPCSEGGTVIALELKGGQEAAFKFLNALEIIIISNNLGDAKSIITHPTTTTHQRLTDDQRAHLGITPGLVRLSLGIEDAQDLLDDIAQALDAV